MQKTVTSVATRLDNPTFNAGEVLHLRDASANIYLGGPDVKTTDGFPVKTTDTVPMVIRVPSDGLWAITATTATVEVLST